MGATALQCSEDAEIKSHSVRQSANHSVTMSLIELSCTAKTSNNANKETDKKILPELGSPPQPGAPAGMVPG